MKTIKKKQTNAVLSHALSFVLALLLCLLAIVTVVGLTLCNSAFLRTQILKSGFSDQVLTELQENYVSYGNAGGFSPEIMKSFVAKDKIQSDMFTNADRLYKGEREALPRTDVQDAAYAAFEADLQSRGISINDAVKESVALLAEVCTIDYGIYVSIPLASYISAYIPKIQKLIVLCVAILLVLTAATSFVLVMLQKRNLQQKLRHLFYAFSAGAVSCVCVPTLFGLFVRMDRVNISPFSVKLLLGSYVDNMLSAFWYMALIYAAVAIALGITLYRGYARYRAALYQEQPQGQPMQFVSKPRTKDRPNQ